MNESRKKQMQEDRESGMTFAEIGKKYGISSSRVGQILGRHCVKNFQPVRNCIYPNLAKWMNENKISRAELTKRIYGNSDATNALRIASYIRGETDIPKRTIDKLLKVTGMTYEVLFQKEDNHDGA